MKILYLMNSRYRGGSQYYVKIIAEEMQRRGHEVAVASRQGKLQIDVPTIDIPVPYVFPFKEVFRRLCIKKLKSVLKSPPDLIHSQQVQPNLIANEFDSSIPIVNTVHAPRKDEFTREMRAELWVAISMETYDFFRSKGLSKELVYVPNPVRFYKSNAERTIDILFVQRDNPRFEGINEKILGNLNCHTMHNVDNPIPYYRKSKIVLATARSALEAMACGAVVVTPDSGETINERMKYHNFTGRGMEDIKILHLAEFLAKLLSEGMEKILQYQWKILQEYEFGHVCIKLEELYEAVCKRK